MKYAHEESPSVGQAWLELEESSRLSLLTKTILNSDFPKILQFTRALRTGSVFITFTEQVSPALRGTLLLDLEEFLKDAIDNGITIWCEPLGDKNALRNLRGVKIGDRGEL